MKYVLLLLSLITLTMCETTGKENLFEGSFSGDPSSVNATLQLAQNDNAVTGTLSMNGEEARLNGSINDGKATGTIIENNTGTSFAFSATITGNDLSMTLSDPSGKSGTFVLKRNQPNNSATTGNDEKEETATSDEKERDRRLLGTWKYVEVLSSGSGDTYLSLSTESFIELREDGTALSWTGRSAGAGTSSNGNAGNPDRAEWYSLKNELHFVEASSNTDVKTLFMVDGSRLMLHNGGSEKKVYTRVE